MAEQASIPSHLPVVHSSTPTFELLGVSFTPDIALQCGIPNMEKHCYAIIKVFSLWLMQVKGLINGGTTLELDNGITKVGQNPDLQRMINDFVPVGWCCNNLA